MILDRQTGYPSVDKPWLNHYPIEAIEATVPESSMYGFVKDNNKDRLGCTAINYFDNKISYEEFFRNVEHVAKCLVGNGIGKDAIICYIRKELPEYYWPKYVEVLDAIPVNQSQKIDYKELEKKTEY